MTHGSSAHLRGIQRHADSCLHGTTGHREPVHLHSKQRMGVHAGVWVCVTEWVVRDTRKEMGGLLWYPTDHIQQSTVKHTDGRERGNSLGGGARADVFLALHAHVVPDDAMTHAILLGRDGWADFPIRKYVDININKTVSTSTAREQRNAENVSTLLRLGQQCSLAKRTKQYHRCCCQLCRKAKQNSERCVMG